LEEALSYGWIKLHRKIKIHQWYKISEWVHLWTHLLLKANHRDQNKVWCGETIILKSGQLITGIPTLVAETGIATSKIRLNLKRLENDKQIVRLTSNRSSLITITNWGEYQADDRLNDSQATVRQQSDNSLATTNKKNKNIKNVNNDKKGVLSSAELKFVQEFDDFVFKVHSRRMESFEHEGIALRAIIKNRNLTIENMCEIMRFIQVEGGFWYDKISSIRYLNQRAKSGDWRCLALLNQARQKSPQRGNVRTGLQNEKQKPPNWGLE
jgi:hypothetical protein